MAPVAWIVVSLVGARLVAELGLSALNRAEVMRHSQAVPKALAGRIDEETYRKSVAYTLAKNRLGQVEKVWETAVLLAALFSGALPALWQIVSERLGSGPVGGATFLLATGFLLGLPGLPLEFWAQFRLEERFGFNRSTIRLWIADKLKGMLLALLLGFPLLALLVGLVRWAGEAWWLWGFGALFGFQLLMLVLYPRLILPLFNRLTPLPEGELRTRLMALSDRAGFRASTIQVIDGSKRSTHSNAFFTGFGRFRRIVLYDTLIEQLSTDELGAVLAHEIGHYRRGHIPRMILLSALLQLAGFAALAWLARQPWFNESFGFPPGEIVPSFLLFGLLSGAVAFWIGPVLNALSRKHEYEADAFAREATGGPEGLLGALRKLSAKNLSNLTPHPLFSGFYYSHPTLLERERALERAA